MGLQTCEIRRLGEPNLHRPPEGLEAPPQVPFGNGVIGREAVDVYVNFNIFQIFLVNESKRLPHSPLGTFPVRDDAMHCSTTEGVTDGHRYALPE